MNNANLYIGLSEVFANATFERLPTVGEYVAYQGQWRPVTIVGHTWSSGSNTPVVSISLGDPVGATQVSFEAHTGPHP